MIHVRVTKKSPAPVKSGVTGLRRGAEDKCSLGDRIRAFRKHLGMNQTEFGELLGDVNVATVSHWENGRPPLHRHFDRMLEAAKEHGGLRKLVGTDERELMLARFRIEDHPPAGALMFLDFAVNEPDDLSAVLVDLCVMGATPTNFATVGETAGPKTEALALVVAPDFPTMDAVKQYLRASERVKDPHVSFRSKGAVQMSAGESLGIR